MSPALEGTCTVSQSVPSGLTVSICITWPQWFGLSLMISHLQFKPDGMSFCCVTHFLVVRWQQVFGTCCDSIAVVPCANFCSEYFNRILMSEWVIQFNSLSQTADSEIDVVHISHVIIAFILESLSFLTKIRHNLQATINLKKKGN